MMLIKMWHLIDFSKVFGKQLIGIYSPVFISYNGFIQSILIYKVNRLLKIRWMISLLRLNIFKLKEFKLRLDNARNVLGVLQMKIRINVSFVNQTNTSNLLQMELAPARNAQLTSIRLLILIVQSRVFRDNRVPKMT